MLRLFVALRLPGDVRDRLAGLGGGVPGARWVEPESLHLTLRFLGETGEERVPDLDRELARALAPPFDLVLEGVGQFGGGRKAHTLWVGAASSAALAHLQAKVESAAVRAGFPPETRKFAPHVTLARLKDTPPERLTRFLAGNGLFRSRPFTVDGFTLFESRQGRTGPVYESLADYGGGWEAEEDETETWDEG